MFKSSWRPCAHNVEGTLVAGTHGGRQRSDADASRSLGPHCAVSAAGVPVRGGAGADARRGVGSTVRAPSDGLAVREGNWTAGQTDLWLVWKLLHADSEWGALRRVP